MDPYYPCHLSCCRYPNVSDRNCCSHVTELLAERIPHFHVSHPQRLQESMTVYVLLLCMHSRWPCPQAPPQGYIRENMWQSQIKIEHYSVVYFDRVTVFKAL